MIVIIFLILLTAACDDSVKVMGMSIRDFKQQVASGDYGFLDGIELSEGKLRELDRRYPGGSWFLGQVYEDAGRDDIADVLYRRVLSDRRSPWYFDALRRVQSREIDNARYQSIISRGDDIMRRSRPDPRTYDWFYTQRFEALLQSELYDQARSELLALSQNYRDYFNSTDLSHSLLYYQAMIHGHFPDDPDSLQYIEPYVFVSNARFGHRELFQLLSGEQPVWLDDIRDWLEVKSLMMDRDYTAALNLLDSLLRDDSSWVILYNPRRPDEGFLRDLYVCAMETRDYGKARDLYTVVLDRLSPNSANYPLLNAVNREYRGRLYLAAGEDLKAADIFEELFFDLNKDLQKAGRPGDRRNYTDGRSLAVTRELMLWRWVSALMDEDDPSLVGEINRAFSWVRNPEYFRDISRGYVSTLIRDRDWGTLHSFIEGAGKDLPDLLHSASIRSLLFLAEQSGFRIAPDELREEQELAARDLRGFLPRYLANQPDSDIRSEDLLYLLPVTRSLPGSLLPVEPGPVSADRSSDLMAILKGYGDFALFGHAADFLSAAEPGFDPGAAFIIDQVREAYDLGDWHDGLALLETAVYRSVLYGSSGAETELDEYISASGSVKNFLKLLYPRAYSSIVEEESQRYGLPPYLMMGLIREESRFDPTAGSHAGARGLGQIVPDTGADIARRMRLENYDLEDPGDNIAMSAYYLAYLRGRFSTVSEALTAYNAGQGRVDDWVADFARDLDGPPAYMYALYIPIEETRDYLPRVMESWYIYELLYDGSGGSMVHAELMRPVIPRQRN